MFKTILIHFVELAQKLLIIMNVFILTRFVKISKNFGLHFLTRKHVEYFLRDVLIGNLDEVSDLLNHITFYFFAKWHIWTRRNQSLSPNITVFKEMINMKYKTEKCITLKDNTQWKFHARWKLFIDSKLSSVMP